MRWPACLFLAYVFVGLQIGGAEYLRVGSARPDLVLLAVIFIAIHAPREAALLGAFSIGIIQDLVSLNPLGVYALAYSMVGMFVVSTQELVYKAHPVTHFTLGLTGGLLCAVVVAIHGWVRGPRASVTELLAAALYTALLAPLVLGLLNLTRGAFAFSRRRRSRAF
jgi:rod shape-determining protein MreD